MSETMALVQQALGEAVMAVVPMLLAGLAGSLVAGLLAVRLGLVDPVAASVLRGLAVLAALWWAADGLVERARGLADEAWSGLTPVGRGALERRAADG